MGSSTTAALEDDDVEEIVRLRLSRSCNPLSADTDIVEGRENVTLVLFDDSDASLLCGKAALSGVMLLDTV